MPVRSTFLLASFASLLLCSNCGPRPAGITRNPEALSVDTEEGRLFRLALSTNVDLCANENLCWQGRLRQHQGTEFVIAGSRVFALPEQTVRSDGQLHTLVFESGAWSLLSLPWQVGRSRFSLLSAGNSVFVYEPSEQQVHPSKLTRIYPSLEATATGEQAVECGAHIVLSDGHRASVLRESGRVPMPNTDPRTLITRCLAETVVVLARSSSEQSGFFFHRDQWVPLPPLTLDTRLFESDGALWLADPSASPHQSPRLRSFVRGTWVQRTWPGNFQIDTMREFFGYGVFSDGRSQWALDRDGSLVPVLAGTFDGIDRSDLSPEHDLIVQTSVGRRATFLLRPDGLTSLPPNPPGAWGTLLRGEQPIAFWYDPRNGKFQTYHLEGEHWVAEPRQQIENRPTPDHGMLTEFDIAQSADRDYLRMGSRFFSKAHGHRLWREFTLPAPTVGAPSTALSQVGDHAVYLLNGELGWIEDADIPVGHALAQHVIRWFPVSDSIWLQYDFNGPHRIRRQSEFIGPPIVSSVVAGRPPTLAVDSGSLPTLNGTSQLSPGQPPSYARQGCGLDQYDLPGWRARFQVRHNVIWGQSHARPWSETLPQDWTPTLRALRRGEVSSMWLPTTGTRPVPYVHWELSGRDDGTYLTRWQGCTVANDVRLSARTETNGLAPVRLSESDALVLSTGRDGPFELWRVTFRSEQMTAQAAEPGWALHGLRPLPREVVPHLGQCLEIRTTSPPLWLNLNTPSVSSSDPFAAGCPTASPVSAPNTTRHEFYFGRRTSDGYLFCTAENCLALHDGQTSVGLLPALPPGQMQANEWIRTPPGPVHAQTGTGWQGHFYRSLAGWSTQWNATYSEASLRFSLSFVSPDGTVSPTVWQSPPIDSLGRADTPTSSEVIGLLAESGHVAVRVNNARVSNGFELPNLTGSVDTLVIFPLPANTPQPVMDALQAATAHRRQTLEAVRSGCDRSADLTIDLDGDGQPEHIRADGCTHRVGIGTDTVQFPMRGRPRVRISDEEGAGNDPPYHGFELSAVGLRDHRPGVRAIFTVWGPEYDEDYIGLRPVWSVDQTLGMTPTGLAQAQACDANFEGSVEILPGQPETVSIDGCSRQLTVRGQVIQLPLNPASPCSFSVSPAEMASPSRHRGLVVHASRQDSEVSIWQVVLEPAPRLLSSTEARNNLCQRDRNYEADLNGDGAQESIVYDGCRRELRIGAATLSGVDDSPDLVTFRAPNGQVLVEGGWNPTSILDYDGSTIRRVSLPPQRYHPCEARDISTMFPGDGSYLVPLPVLESCRVTAHGRAPVWLEQAPTDENERGYRRVRRRTAAAFLGYPDLMSVDFAERYWYDAARHRMRREPGYIDMDPEQGPENLCDYRENVATSCQAACPFVYTEDIDHNLVFRGEILRNLRHPTLERSQSLTIPVVIGADGAFRVQIAERKDETTYLDSIAIEWNGQRLRPNECETAAHPYCAEDGQYMVIRRGEAIELTFQTDERQGGPTTSAVELWANGYYLPNDT